MALTWPTAGYVYVSGDSGVTWTKRDPAGGGRKWNAIASSSDGTKIVAATEGNGIYRSANRGSTWSLLSGAGSWVFTSIASSSDGTTIAATVQSGNIWVSLDSGSTWTARAPSVKWKGVTMSADGSKLVAVQDTGFVYKSTDGGTSWAILDVDRGTSREIPAPPGIPPAA